MRLETCTFAGLAAAALMGLSTARAAEGDWLNFGNGAGGTGLEYAIMRCDVI
jgi:hypothetical protein